jgi:hypothetical protein
MAPVLLVHYTTLASCVKSGTMPTRGGSSLNRILKVTAHLLFEKGQEVSDVYGLLQGFVDRAMLEKWFRAYRSLHGIGATNENEERADRIPLPPIDWDAVNVNDLNKLTQSEQVWF